MDEIAMTARIFALWALSFFITTSALAGYSATMPIVNSPVVSCGSATCTPLDLCSAMRAEYNSYWQPRPPGGTLNPTCGVWARGSFSNTWIVRYAIRTWNGGPLINETVTVNPTSGGNTCWNTAWAAGSTNPPSTHACGVCDPPKVMIDGECVAPSCPEGQQWDPSINMCRSSCTSSQVYHYALQQCVPQCQTGKWFDGFTTEFFDAETGKWFGNRDLTGLTAYHNGCKVQTESACAPSAETDGRGLMCMHFFKYVENGQEDQAWQVSHPQFTGQAVPETGTAPVDGKIRTLNPYEGNLQPVVIASKGNKCVDGTFYEYVTANGQIYDTRALGKCFKVGDSPTNQFQNSSLGAAVAANTNAVNTNTETLTGVATSQENVENAIDTIVAQLDNVMDAIQEIPPTAPAGEFTAPGNGEGYQRTMPGGLEQALEGADAVDGSGLADFFNSADLSLGTSAPECITFTGNLPFVGPVSLTPYCPIWDALATLMMVMASIAAWFIVFGPRT